MSSHYIVGTDGSVVQAVAEKDGAWGNGVLSAGHDPWWSDSVNPNNITISIEHCKPSLDNSDTLTPLQQAASFKLIHGICTRWDILRSAANVNGGITGHYSIDPVSRKNCPGPYPWDALWVYLNQEAAVAGVPQNWKDDGVTLTAPNGYTVQAGFRSYILNHNWPSDNLPLSQEVPLSPVEISNPTIGPGTRQTFRFSILEHTHTLGTFTGYIGQELLVSQVLITQLQAQIKKP